MIFLTNFSPQQEVRLENGIVITKHKRCAILFDTQGGTGEMREDSISIKGYSGNSDLKLWVIFHSFIFNSLRTLNGYEARICGKLNFLDDDCVDLTDYSNIFSSVYFAQGNLVSSPISYSELFNIFLRQEQEDINLVISYLTHLSNSSFTGSSNPITDRSYWQLMIYYSIIDKIITQQRSCQGISCTVCGKTNIPHYPKTDAAWLSERIVELVPDNVPVQNAYLEIINVVKKYIRNDTIHYGVVPTATEHPQIPIGEEIIYDIERIIGNYQTDPTALLSLVHLLGDTTRFLLLNRIFSLNYFPIPSSVRSVRIAG